MSGHRTAGVGFRNLVVAIRKDFSSVAAVLNQAARYMIKLRGACVGSHSLHTGLGTESTGREGEQWNHGTRSTSRRKARVRLSTREKSDCSPGVQGG